MAPNMRRRDMRGRMTRPNDAWRLSGACDRGSPVTPACRRLSVAVGYPSVSFAVNHAMVPAADGNSPLELLVRSALRSAPAHQARHVLFREACGHGKQ